MGGGGSGTCFGPVRASLRRLPAGDVIASVGGRDVLALTRMGAIPALPPGDVIEGRDVLRDVM